jgi:hypothetical protein
MVGPYISAELIDGVFLDVRAAWGQSHNDASIDVFQTGLPFAGSFDTDRWLVRAILSGEWDLGRIIIRPEASVGYIEEKQRDYVVSEGVHKVDVSGQRLSLGRFEVGPEILLPFNLWDLEVQSFVKPRLLWDFDSSAFSGLIGIGSTSDDVRGAVDFGFRWTSQMGHSGGIAAQYDGIGASGFRALSIRGSVAVPF